MISACRNGGPPRDRGELHGWDAIARYLGVTRRTAQNYERDGLPVRRGPGQRGRVWALCAELDAWRSGTPQRVEQPASSGQALEAESDYPQAGQPPDNHAAAFGGHMRHVVVASALYGINYVLMLLIEVAYQFDRLGGKALLYTPALFLVVAGTTALILWRAAVPSPPGRTRGTSAALVALVAVAIAVCAFVSVVVLPNHAVTEDRTTGWTARLAYVKDTLYIVPVAVFYLVIPFHFVLAVQKEIVFGRAESVFALLCGHNRAVPPLGTWCVRAGVLWTALVAVLLLFVPMTWHLLDSLEPSPFLTLFSSLILVRLVAFFALAIECTVWYGGMINSIKRGLGVVAVSKIVHIT